MTKDVQHGSAPGGPGMEPRWTRGAKEAVGTAYSTSSRIWYTLSSGCVTEVYYPTIDSPQIRDLQYLITDGATFFHDERRHLLTEMDCVSEAALGFKVTNRDPTGRYAIAKTVLGDPHQNCLLVHTSVSGAADFLRTLQLFVLCAPHLEIGGWHNNGRVLSAKGRKILIAQRGNIWLALGATIPFAKVSCGFVGVNDGWTDLADNLQMDWEYEAATDGNIALTGQLNLSEAREFTLGLAFGATEHDAITTLFQSLSVPFRQSRAAFADQWQRTSRRFVLMDRLKGLDSNLFERSVNLLLTHEDKVYPGAMIASLSIPWGEDKGDDELGGYHLVWTRDMVNCATGLLAVGDTATPLRTLIYLAVSQREDGGFYQNFWIDGRPYWHGTQLDEVSFPIILAWRLRQCRGLGEFDPYSMVMHACRFLIDQGPRTPQDRWEEAGGYSPYTLATNIAALICAAEFMDSAGDTATAEFVREYADFLESKVEKWTVTSQGTLVPGISRHYVRINPGVEGEGGEEDLDHATLTLSNQAPGAQYRFPAKDIVDAGFLQLVRYGIRDAKNPLIENSLEVIDKLLQVQTPLGPCWYRYNHDGYGQRGDGTSFQHWGRGRLWPLLTAERGHYELAAGRDPRSYLRTIERFAHGIGLIPEQVWDSAELPAQRLQPGKPIGAAIPLMWAHAEYLKLLRSTADGKVFDAIEPVFERYQRSAGRRSNLEVWSFQRRIRFAPAGTRIRIIAGAGFMLHWTSDEWTNSTDARSVSTGLGIHYVDIIADRAKGRLKFTFFWPDTDRWEGQDFQIELLPCEESHGDASGVRTYREQIAPRDSDAKGRQQRCEAVETSR